VGKTEGFQGSKEAVLDGERCVGCGVCRENCRFEAIDEGFHIDPFRCEGCGVCAFLCPVGAIELRPRVSGYVHLSSTRFGTLVHGELEPGEGTSGKLVTLVKQRALELAQFEGEDLIIIDGSPGIGCPVIASLSGATAALVVAEPTLSGVHDLERVLGVARHFRTKAFICINKYDLNEAVAQRIERFAEEQGLEVIGRIPYDETVTEAMVQGKTVIEWSNNGRVAREIRRMWAELSKVLEVSR